MVNNEVKRFFAGFALVSLLATIAQSQSSTPAPTTGTLVSKHPGGTPAAKVDCANDYKLKCADCRNIAICAGEAEPRSVQSCASYDANHPYCVDGHCSSVLPAESPVCSAEFRCSSEGYFPHPSDCSKYYFCDKVNGIAYEYSCGENRVYLSREKSCVNRTNETDCQTINCRDATNSFVRYTPHLAIYAYCSDQNGRKETILYKCSDEYTSVFDPATLTCVYTCPGEGRHMNPVNCGKFYECYHSGLHHQAIEWSCPTGFYFNEELKRCELGDCPVPA